MVFDGPPDFFNRTAQQVGYACRNAGPSGDCAAAKRPDSPRKGLDVAGHQITERHRFDEQQIVLDGGKFACRHDGRPRGNALIAASSQCHGRQHDPAHAGINPRCGKYPSGENHVIFKKPLAQQTLLGLAHPETRTMGKAIVHQIHIEIDSPLNIGGAVSVQIIGQIHHLFEREGNEPGLQFFNTQIGSGPRQKRMVLPGTTIHAEGFDVVVSTCYHGFCRMAPGLDNRLDIETLMPLFNPC